MKPTIGELQVLIAKSLLAIMQVLEERYNGPHEPVTDALYRMSDVAEQLKERLADIEELDAG